MKLLLSFIVLFSLVGCGRSELLDVTPAHPKSSVPAIQGLFSFTQKSCPNSLNPQDTNLILGQGEYVRMKFSGNTATKIDTNVISGCVITTTFDFSTTPDTRTLNLKTTYCSATEQCYQDLKDTCNAIKDSQSSLVYTYINKANLLVLVGEDACSTVYYNQGVLELL